MAVGDSYSSKEMQSANSPVPTDWATYFIYIYIYIWGKRVSRPKNYKNNENNTGIFPLSDTFTKITLKYTGILKYYRLDLFK